MRLFSSIVFLVQYNYAFSQQGKQKAFRCSDGKLIPLQARCDGYPDCASENDEHSCNYQVPRFSPNPTLAAASFPSWPADTSRSVDTSRPVEPTWSILPANQVNRWSVDPAAVGGQTSVWNMPKQTGYVGQPQQFTQEATGYQQPPQPPAECRLPPPESCPVPWMTQTDRWYFNSANLACQPFKYSCGDGTNNFQSESECRLMCGGVPGQPSTGQNVVGTEDQYSPTYYSGGRTSYTGSSSVTGGRSRVEGESSNWIWKSTENLKLLTQRTFRDFVRNNDLVLVEFFAPWCNVCREFQPRLERFVGDFRLLGISTVKVNGDMDRELVRYYNIERFPTLLFFGKDLINSPRRYKNSNGLNSSAITTWVYSLLRETGYKISDEVIESIGNYNRYPSSVSSNTWVSGNVYPARPEATETTQRTYLEKPITNIGNQNTFNRGDENSIIENSTRTPPSVSVITTVYSPTESTSSSINSYPNSIPSSYPSSSPSSSSEASSEHRNQIDDTTATNTILTSTQNNMNEKETTNESVEDDQDSESYMTTNKNTDTSITNVDAPYQDVPSSTSKDNSATEASTNTYISTQDTGSTSTNVVPDENTNAYQPIQVSGTFGSTSTNVVPDERTNTYQPTQDSESFDSTSTNVVPDESTNVYQPTQDSESFGSTSTNVVPDESTNVYQPTQDYDDSSSTTKETVTYAAASISPAPEKPESTTIKTETTTTDANAVKNEVVTPVLQTTEKINENTYIGSSTEIMMPSESDKFGDYTPITITEKIEVPRPVLDTCNVTCTREYRPVCGSNNVTYSNICMYNAGHCKDPSLYLLGTGTCSALVKQQTCKRTEFLCRNKGTCISYLRTCDGREDCDDGADELLCHSCTKNQFTCGDGTCVDYSKRCNQIVNCADSSDEVGCPPPCHHDEFTCNDGSCVPQSSRCNGEVDCIDMTDEIGCQAFSFCSSSEWMCRDSRKCIEGSRRCDGYVDCSDHSDEEDCPPVICSAQEWKCADGRKCIDASRKCDQYQDCGDGSDERGCSSTGCNPQEWMCADQRRCVDVSRICDGYPDCGDVSDEQNCPTGSCNSQWLFECSNSSLCIDVRRRCDGYDDCSDKSDERGCLAVQCQDWQFKCAEDGICLHFGLQCNGEKDCRDGSDELGCDQSEEVSPDDPRLPNNVIETTAATLETDTTPWYKPTEPTYRQTPRYEIIGGPAVDESQWYETTVRSAVDKSQWYETTVRQAVDQSQWYETTARPAVGESQWYGTTATQTVEENPRDETTARPAVEENPWYETTARPAIEESQGFETTARSAVEESPWYETTARTAVEESQENETSETNDEMSQVFETTTIATEYQNQITTEKETAEQVEAGRTVTTRVNDENISTQETTTSQYDGGFVTSIEDDSTIDDSGIPEESIGLLDYDTSADSATDESTATLETTVTYGFVEDTTAESRTENYQDELCDGKDDCLDGNDFNNREPFSSSPGKLDYGDDPFGFDKCNNVCSREYIPVCASNGITYANKCTMEKAACETDHVLDVLHEGACDDQLIDPDDGLDPSQGQPSPAAAGQPTQTETSVGQLSCDEECSQVSQPVCGSDGVTYNNECLLWKFSCLNNDDIRIVNNGTCQTITESPDDCNRQCLEVEARVCGDDGITYLNVCKMKMEACQDGLDITAIHQGECRTDQTAGPEDPLSSLFLCPTSCVAEYLPVCGDNGVTYVNECMLRKEECEKDVIINIKHQGACADRCVDQCSNADEMEVCGSDGITYSSRCRMDLVACRENRIITIHHNGSCDSCSMATHWVCDDGSCVDLRLKCDGRADCTDGSDEEFCEFICQDGSAISWKQYCDGYPDCMAGDDESGCLGLTSPLRENSTSACDSSDEYLCKGNSTCIPRELVCNGKSDCPDEDDEFDCPTQPSNFEPRVDPNAKPTDDPNNSNGPPSIDTFVKDYSNDEEGRGDITTEDDIIYEDDWL